MTSFDHNPIDVKECKYFKNWEVTCPINEDGKIVTSDSEKMTLIAVHDCPDKCKMCNMNRTCFDLHLSILADKSAHKKRVWIRNAGQYAITKTPLSTRVINLKKMIKEFSNLTS